MLVAPHNLAMEPVFGGISGSTRTIFKGSVVMEVLWWYLGFVEKGLFIPIVISFDNQNLHWTIMSFTADNTIKGRGRRDGRFTLIIVVGWLILFTTVLDRSYWIEKVISICWQQPTIESDFMLGANPQSPNDALFSFGKIPINTANRDLLMTIDGIGPKLAETIVEHRKKNGVFSRAADLKQIKGIGQKRVDRFALIFDFKNI